MGQITVFSGPERRRRWSDDERLRILAEAFSPGAGVVDVCRRHDVSYPSGGPRLAGQVSERS